MTDSVKITLRATYTYRSLLTAIFKGRGLRVEIEDNVCAANKDAGIDLEKMAEEGDTYRCLVLAILPTILITSIFSLS